MASLHKDSQGRTANWQCSFMDETGKWRLRSTGTKDRAEAERICNQWQRGAEALRPSRKLENREQVLEALISATKRAERGEFTEATARDVLDSILKATGQAPMRTVTIAGFLNEWTDSKDVSKAVGTARRYRHTVRTFLEFLGNRAGLTLNALTSRDVEGFRDIQLKEGKSAATANMAVKTLRIPLNLARRQGLILTNPAETVDMLDNASRKRVVFTNDQLSTLLRAADWEWRGMILLGYYGGLRLGDAARLTWASVDFERKSVRFTPQKTGRRGQPVEVPLAPELEEFLLVWPGANDRPNAPLLPTLSKLRTGGCNGLSARFRKLMAGAGVEGHEHQPRTKGKGRKFHELTFHSLRHTCVSAMANNGVAREVRMKITGHTSDAHERYTHLEFDLMRQALSTLPRLLE